MSTHDSACLRLSPRTATRRPKEPQAPGRSGGAQGLHVGCGAQGLHVGCSVVNTAPTPRRSPVGDTEPWVVIPRSRPISP